MKCRGRAGQPGKERLTATKKGTWVDCMGTITAVCQKPWCADEHRPAAAAIATAEVKALHTVQHGHMASPGDGTAAKRDKEP